MLLKASAAAPAGEGDEGEDEDDEGDVEDATLLSARSMGRSQAAGGDSSGSAAKLKLL